ncbi:MAG: type II secretion system GspH family protein [Deltaproteobacteria bacterium]|nr:type II secretion system GspH family protein [Deltaproteobacteria bacterium]
MSSTRDGEKGFTLIEVMIVVLIIGMMMGLGVAVLFPGDEAKLRDQSAKLAGTIKFLYNEAAVKNKYFRLNFDLDAQAYSVESSTEPFLVRMVEEAPTKKSADAAKDAPEGTPSATFTEESGFLVQSSKLPDGIKFKDIFVMHLKERQEHGKVEVYFFPNGFVEPLVVNMTDEDEQSVYSLQVNPLTGKAKIRSEYYEAKPEELLPQPREETP